MKLIAKLKEAIVDASNKLKGTDRRTFIAQVAGSYGRGGQRKAAAEFGWGRNTIRKGEQELETGIEYVDKYDQRGANPVEEQLPNLRADIKDIVEELSQTDPTLKTTQIYRRITAPEVRRQLQEQKGYTDEQLPTERTIRTRLNDMGYKPAKVRKSKPKKKSQKQTKSLRG